MASPQVSRRPAPLPLGRFRSVRSSAAPDAIADPNVPAQAAPSTRIEATSDLIGLAYFRSASAFYALVPNSARHPRTRPASAAEAAPPEVRTACRGSPIPRPWRATTAARSHDHAAQAVGRTAHKAARTSGAIRPPAPARGRRTQPGQRATTSLGSAPGLRAPLVTSAATVTRVVK